MNVSKIFDFLVNEYLLKYAKQEFKHCYGGNWTVVTYSYYNESGCFSIYSLPERGELDFFYSKNFSDDLDKLCSLRVNVESIGAKIWQKAKKKIFFKYRHKLFLRTLAEVIRYDVQLNGSFFGIKVL